ncbi:putative triacylglycerol lipase [Helianthus annuus]|uniref:Putative alpha/Beta hydrolase fold protein n=1 Tax=Helianthus annuus TaxID=4232 RepID=A0A251SB83_HELAN|nr:triacylglycerol lipase OBL1 [Helianthus annuus]KAF5766292.1 putative triacylglycerol lipase [Helianthus annuus]KAJ0452707.1 putative triacylglycerol lipase [Helianthus annuus]KAJ0457683.1 putative triacylglycerol lipase [Helianthus annuus]KAJ0474617.1 putative triacylglycerol lipase [Helianthus annuus]KAJ0650174.1 putative triacylglycerol lipase [Helianthus annuus]
MGDDNKVGIWVTIVIIRGLKLFAGWLVCIGSFVESSLNLWSYYDSFYMLVLNTLRGKNVELSRESPNFSSLVGLTDTRVELDDGIPRDDPRYVSALAIMAAKTAYENKARVEKIVEDHWKMEYVDFYNCSNAYETESSVENKHPTQAFIFIDNSGDHDLISVSFRGTSLFSADDLCTDVDLSWFILPGVGKVHMGFMKALGLQNNASWPKEIEQDDEDDRTFAYYKIRQVLREKLVENEHTRFIVTGHSLGGALAVLFPAILGFHNEYELLERLDGVYTFGQPRVGDGDFCKFMEDLLGDERYFRFVYSNDIIPRIPFDDSNFQYKHFGHCYYFNSLYKGQVTSEEPNKNYFALSSMGQMYLNSVFELVRSVVLPFTCGKKYKEGIVQFGVRLIGLGLPGLSAHGLQDYVNLTRLGSPDLFSKLQGNSCKSKES